MESTLQRVVFIYHRQHLLVHINAGHNQLRSYFSPFVRGWAQNAGYFNEMHSLMLAPRRQALPHTDFCFYAFPVKQLVGLNRSNDVSTSSAPTSFPRRARKIKRTCCCAIGINLECAVTKNQAYSKGLSKNNFALCTQTIPTDLIS
jgi:hypothetical protein